MELRQLEESGGTAEPFWALDPDFASMPSARGHHTARCRSEPIANVTTGRQMRDRLRNQMREEVAKSSRISKGGGQR